MDDESVYQGDSKSKGIDFFIKKEFNRHSAWVSYSLSKTEEYFPYFEDDIYRRALHDQRHEVKLAGIFNIRPFYISANYVYGSGFPDPSPLLSDDLFEQAYSRLDAAVIYRFSRNRYSLETGLSVLNVFNRENIKYSNFVRVPTNLTGTVNIHAEAVPRTLTVFLNMSF